MGAEPIEATATESDTPVAPSEGVTDTQIPIPPADPANIDWHVPEGQTGYSWGELQQLSNTLSTSNLVPAPFRQQPANIVLMAVTGQELGWGIATAMRFITIIEGKPTVSPEGMLALIRRAGHSVRGESSAQQATISGRRIDSGDEMTVTFTMADAVRAKLAGKSNWQTYPEAMLWARALAMLARRLFSDVLLGAAYVPDEMGANTDAMGNFIDTTGREDTGQNGQGQRRQDAPVPPDWDALHWDLGIKQFDAAMRDTKRMLNLLPEDVKAAVREECGPPPPTAEYSMNVWARRHEIVVRAARELGLGPAFGDTTPDLTALQATGAPDLTDLAGGVETAAGPNSAEPSAPPANLPAQADEDAADAAWVAEALATDDTTTVVSLDPDEPV